MSDFTPLKGNPADVSEAAARLRTAANNMRDARHDIGRMVKFSNFSSRAVEAITENADEVRTALNQARQRYSAAAKALRQWSQDMETAQMEAKAAAKDHEAATSDLTAAQTAYDDARDDQKAAGASDEDVQDAKKRAQAADCLVDSAHGARSDAWGRYQDAVKYYNAGARKAATAINEANEATNDKTIRDLGTAFWKAATNLAGKILDFLDEHLWKVGLGLLAVLVVVAIVFTGPFGVAAAAALLKLMFVVGVLEALVKTAQYSRGKASGWEVVVAWVFVAAPGVGKVIRMARPGVAQGGKRAARGAGKPETSKKGGGSTPAEGTRPRNRKYKPEHRREDAPIKPREEARKAVRDHILQDELEHAPEHFKNRRDDRSSNGQNDFRDYPPAPRRPRAGSPAPAPVCRAGG